MAGPGMGKGAVDLSAMGRQAAHLGKPLTEAERRKFLVEAEKKLPTLRCAGCGERIGMGFEFVLIDPHDGGDKVQVDVKKVSACSRASCGYAEVVRQDATYCTMIENVWLDGNGDGGADLPPADPFEGRAEPGPGE